MEKMLFDDLGVGSTLEQPYQHLKFSPLTVRDSKAGQGARAIIPQSKPNYAAIGPFPSPLTPQMSWSTSGTETTSFDVHDYWAGCITTNGTKSGYVATNCDFTVQCITPFGIGHEGPYLERYRPSGPKNAAMMKVTPGFSFCTSFSGSVYSSDGGTASTLLVIDSLNYTIREGEVFNPNG
ncbi:MAG: hypothetical protein Q9163_001714 [Psora crenata]